MDLIGFAVLVVIGFTSCAEFGSYAFVHPVIRHLPSQHHLFVEKGLLKTFGRVMPVLMTLSLILSLSYARRAADAGRYSEHSPLGVGCFVSTGAYLNHHLQCANQLDNRKMGSRAPARELERGAESMGVLPGSEVVAIADRIRAHVRCGDVALNKALCDARAAG